MGLDPFTQTEAARNVALKEKYPRIADPILAINFALEVGDMECHDFLSVWRDGDWCGIEDYDGFAPFLQHVAEVA